MSDVHVPDAISAFECINHSRSRVTVAVSLFNYSDVVLEALESVRAQDLDDIDLIVVDDGSRDDSTSLVDGWLKNYRARFGRSLLLQHVSNAGLAAARNQAFAAAVTPYVFVLDADNLLYPRCLRACLDTAACTDAAAVYTALEVFGESCGLMGTDDWDPDVLLRANYIDAMALVRRRSWADVGGYRRMPVPGWEDYDFWLKFAEMGLDLARVPEILCRYRLRAGSMLRQVTNQPESLHALHADIRLHHPGVILEGDPNRAAGPF